jgi:hypothetical protein
MVTGDVVFRAFQTYVLGVSIVLDVCFKCFIWMFQKYILVLHMLQMFHLNVSKVDSGVAMAT